MVNGVLSASEILDHPQRPERQERFKEKMTYPGLLERVRNEVENDPDEDSKEVAKLSPNKSPEVQEEGMVAMQGRLIEIIAKLKPHFDSLNVLRTHPQEIFRKIREAKISLDPHESNALFHLQRLMRGAGETADYFRDPDVWDHLVSEGLRIGEDARLRYRELYRKHPVLTGGVTVGMFLGAGFLLARRWFKKGSEAAPSAPDASSGSGPIFTRRRVVVGGVLAALAGALYFGGREGSIDWLKDAVKDQYLPSIDGLGGSDVKNDTKNAEGSNGEAPVEGGFIGEAKKTIDSTTLSAIEKAKKTGQPLSPEAAKILEGNPELMDFISKNHESKELKMNRPSEMVVISDSIGLGMRNRVERRYGEGPDFIGQGGRGTDVILGHLKDNKEKLSGKKMALISAGGNNPKNYSPEVMVSHIREMVGVCQEAGIPKIVVMSRYPYLSAYDSNSTLPDKMVKLVAALEREFGDDPGVDFVDIYNPLIDPRTNRLPPHYNNKYRSDIPPDKRDQLHPFKAYEEGWEYVADQTNTPEIREWLAGKKKEV